jgi:hypothetical protein
MRAVALFALLLLAACGSKVALKPKEGNALPMKPQTASAVPTPDQLLTKRSDEQLKRSQERQDDKFDLPPPG